MFHNLAHHEISPVFIAVKVHDIGIWSLFWLAL